MVRTSVRDSKNYRNDNLEREIDLKKGVPLREEGIYVLTLLEAPGTSPVLDNVPAFEPQSNRPRSLV